MKTAEQWQEELAGETSVESIRLIQSDALLGALEIVQRNRNKLGITCDISDKAMDILRPPNAPRQPEPVGDRLHADVGREVE